MKRKVINRFFNPPRIYASVDTDGDAVVRQVYNVISATYYPDRKLVPLVLTPVVGFSEPKAGVSVDRANSMLSDGKWYRFDNTTDGSFTPKNEVVSGKKVPGSSTLNLYEINSNAGSDDYGELISRENVEPGNPVTYVFVATLNYNEGYRVKASFRVESEQESVVPRLSFDNAEQVLFDPIDPNRINEFTINPVISPSSLSAVFSWQILIDGNWVGLDDSFKNWCVNPSGNGVRINRRLMPDEIVLKCKAIVSVGAQSVSLERVISQCRRISPFDYDIANVTSVTESDKTIAPKAIIREGRNVISDPGEELSVSWYGSSAAAIASGINPVINISSLGAAMDLGLEVLDSGGYKALLDDDGAPVVDDDGVQIVVK